MLKKLYSRLNLGKDWYYTYKKEIKLASHIKIKNKLLYQELEQECKKKNGILTYAEYLTIDQFGKNGYYSTSKHHGKTDVEKRWGGALANYCKQQKYDTIIEFGCGTGELGVASAKAYRQLLKKKLKWIGVEIDESIHAKILENFTSQNEQDSVEKIVTTLDEIPNHHHALTVFPYSLDNIPPHVFLNTQSVTSYPDALLGIIVKNGTISEVIVPPEILQKKNLYLKNGFFTQDGHTSDLTNWKIRKGKRAYISTDAYLIMNKFAKKFGDKTTFIIIDEFRKEPWFFNLENLGIPKSLHEHNLVCTDRTRYYRESGKHNLYYPLYKDCLMQFLNAIGLRSVEFEIEQKKANQLRNKPWFPLGKNYRTFAFFAKDFVDKKNETLVIPFNAQRLF
jgi:hypothetical protein